MFLDQDSEKSYLDWFVGVSKTKLQVKSILSLIQSLPCKIFVERQNNRSKLNIACWCVHLFQAL